MSLTVMRMLTGSVALILFGAVSQYCSGQETTEVVDDELNTAIRKVTATFEEAFNESDASALADVFAENGEFIDLNQLVYQGREAIQAEFEAAFSTMPGTKINIEIDSVRSVAEGVVIEDGQATVERENGTAHVSRYASVYVKEGDSWKIASLRDLASEPMSPGDSLMSLQWLIGDWVSESADGVVEQNFYWSQDGNFILGEFSVTVDGELTISGDQRLAWDPLRKEIRGWIFDSEGSQLRSTWTPLEDSWMVKVEGVNPDGSLGSAVNYYRTESGDQLIWNSTQRIVAGESEEDIEVTLSRKPPAPNSGDSEK